jgi:hypothetical protein
MKNDSTTQLDLRLKELALLAQQYPSSTKERRMALTQLVDAIWLSGQLCRPQIGQFYLVYDDIYEEAVQSLFCYLCQDDNIKKYDPQRSEFITWINMLLTKRFFPEAIPIIIGRENEVSLEIFHVENVPSNDDSSLYEQLIECIEEDPEEIFSKAHIKNHPEANFQALARRRYSGISWKDISDEWGISVFTLSKFYQRYLKIFAPKFREYL